MISRILEVSLYAFLMTIIACSDGDNTAGVTEDGNPAFAAAFEVEKPDHYDLWSVDTKTSDKDNSGYWFDLNSWEDDPAAVITFPAMLGDGSSSDSMKAIVDSCGGVCGTVEFVNSLRPMLTAGVGFSLDKGNSLVDASSWNGLCVSYESDFNMRVKLSLDKDEYATVNGDLPYAEFPKMLKLGTRCAKWESFKHSNAGNVAIEEAVKKVGSLVFEFIGKPNQKGSFNIKGFTSLKDVEQNAGASSSSQSSSSSNATSSVKVVHDTFNDVCSFVSIDDLWYGPHWEPQLELPLDDGSMTTTSWYVLSGIGSTEVSRIKWPVAKSGGSGATAMTPIVEYCSGICGDFVFDSDGYAGIAIDLAGGTSINGVKRKYVGVSDWGGLCVTYASTRMLQVVTNSAGWQDAANDYFEMGIFDMPMVKLPSSQHLVTECFKWSEFIPADGDPVEPDKMVSIYFIAEGGAGVSGKFNIVGLGRYQDLEHPECAVKEKYVSGS